MTGNNARPLGFAALALGVMLAGSLLLNSPPKQAHAQQNGPVYCSQYAHGTAASTTLLITAPVSPSTAKIYVCGWSVYATSAGATNLQYGTGATCGVGTTALTDAMTLPLGISLTDTSSQWKGMVVPANQNVCFTATGSMQWQIFYTVQ